MTDELVAEHRAEWVDILHCRFKIEIAHDRQLTFVRSLMNFGVSIGETPLGLLQRAKSRKLTAEHWAQIIHLATNHETRFFRYRPVIDLVCDLAGEFARTRLLSVGCSTGEEPYSFAVALSAQKVGNFRVHGTDISRPCIDTARAGIYRANEHISEHYARRHDHSLMKVCDWVKELVTFEQHNILSDQPIDFHQPNIIVTQNMLIYYKPETRHRILNQLSVLVEDGGYLITGPAEDATWTAPGFERLSFGKASVFRKLT